MRDRCLKILNKQAYFALLGGALLAGCTPDASANKVGASQDTRAIVVAANTAGSKKISGEIWVDNWFALYVNGSKLIEDSVPITTERSFNAERVSFSADLPMTLAFEFRDFMENATGLEYIGTGRQQMGDGGAIAQFRDATSGKTVAVTNADWRCLVVQHAPASGACARERDPQIDRGACARKVTPVPDGWASPGFDDSGWTRASIHSASSVRPKGGYDGISWNRAAKIIWGPDLERDNIVLCRVTVRK
jgi:hypothetical protein